MYRFIIHYALHFLFPGLVGWICFRNNWKKAWFIMLLAMLVDIDHLFADPIYDPMRCSIGAHFLHSYPAISVYIVLLFLKPMQVVASGLVIHMFTDAIDCLLLQISNGKCI